MTDRELRDAVNAVMVPALGREMQRIQAETKPILDDIEARLPDVLRLAQKLSEGEGP